MHCNFGHIQTQGIYEADPRYFMLRIPWQLFDNKELLADSPLPLLFYLKIASHYEFTDGKVKALINKELYYDTSRNCITTNSSRNHEAKSPLLLSHFRYVPMSVLFCLEGSIIQRFNAIKIYLL